MLGWLQQPTAVEVQVEGLLYIFVLTDTPGQMDQHGRVCVSTACIYELNPNPHV